MPELPEVETTVQGLKRYTEQCQIDKVLFHRDNIRYPLDSTWIPQMEGQKILSVSRRAKLIIMQLEQGYLLWHLGMTGSLRVSFPHEPKRQHDHVELQLNSQRILRFHDPRRFGYLKWFASETAWSESIAHYGPEPLSSSFNADYLWRLSRGKKQAVKNFIMDQAVVVGVGNIYACEALFYTGIRPQQLAGKVSKARYQRLVEEIKKVLSAAIEQGGTTLKDFENAEAKPGYFQQVLAVYGREGEACPSCEKAIQTVKLGGRNSFYCSQCQK